jgi:hypothetical protein
MKKILLALVILASFSLGASAQDYTTGIGVRTGYYNGLTVKQFLGGKSAVEGIVTTRWQGFNVTVLYELHRWSAFDVDRLNWYYGVGGHIGFWNGTYTTWGVSGTSYMVIGIDGILGIEYNFEEIPLNLSLDWKPAINLIGYSSFWVDGAAFSARYIF